QYPFSAAALHRVVAPCTGTKTDTNLRVVISRGAWREDHLFSEMYKGTEPAQKKEDPLKLRVFSSQFTSDSLQALQSNSEMRRNFCIQKNIFMPLGPCLSLCTFVIYD